MRNFIPLDDIPPDIANIIKSLMVICTCLTIIMVIQAKVVSDLRKDVIIIEQKLYLRQVPPTYNNIKKAQHHESTHHHRRNRT